MSYSAHVSFNNYAVVLLKLGVGLGVGLGGCASNQPDLGPASWYRGTTTVEPSNATVFGPTGDVAIEWQQFPDRGVWIWRENRSNGWNEQTVWTARSESSFNADVSTGAWSGPVVVQNAGDTGLYLPGGWTCTLHMTNGSGTITGTGETSGPGGSNFGSSGSAGALFNVWIKWSWIRPDGSVGARLTQQLDACNEQEYLSAVQRLGGTATVVGR